MDKQPIEHVAGAADEGATKPDAGTEATASGNPVITITADDRFRILDLLGRYILAVDTGDTEAVLACFAPDAWVRYEGGGAYQGIQELQRFVDKVTAADTAGRMHLNFPLFIEQEGPVVVVHSYLSIAQWHPPAPPSSFETLRYVRDHCVRSKDGAWRILGRHIAIWNSETQATFRPMPPR